MAATEGPIVFPSQIRERLLAAIYERLPLKSFGYLISTGDSRQVDDFILFEDNTRNSEEWKGRFQAYGQYFLDHDDAGFVSSPEETWRIQKEMWRRGMTEVGIFHSHLRHPANFSGIDFDMHISRYLHLWHMIVAVRNRAMPQVRIFDVMQDRVREQEVAGNADVVAAPTSVTSLETLFALDAQGRPSLKFAQQILEAIAGLSQGDYDRLITHGLLAGNEARYEQHIAPHMRTIPAKRFLMGTSTTRRRHYVGECPAHEVHIPSFSISTLAVTNRCMGLLEPSRLEPKEDLHKPAVNVTWHEAKLFALWMNCRLPSEAEWEYSCGAGSKGQWTCDPKRLSALAWYSENSRGLLQQVGQLEPNAFGLYDMHGNVWEWCEDEYGQDAYDGTSPIGPDRVCRGGSVHALAEMCRTRYRLHEPKEFFAADLGFRLVKGASRW